MAFHQYSPNSPHNSPGMTALLGQELEFTLPTPTTSSDEEQDDDDDDDVSVAGPGALTQAAASSLLAFGSHALDTSSGYPEEEAEEQTAEEQEPPSDVFADAAPQLPRQNTVTPTPFQQQQQAPAMPDQEARIMAKATEIAQSLGLSFEAALYAATMSIRESDKQSQTSNPQPMVAPAAPPQHTFVADTSTKESIDSRALSLAKALRDGEGDGLDFTEDELVLYQTCTRSSNQAKYDKRHDSTERRFFACIQQYGGSTLACLLEIEQVQYDGLGDKEDYAFYNLVGGEKTEAKRKILNTCLVLCALKFKCQTGPRKGEPLEPVSFRWVMKVLFYRFHDKDVQYDFVVDFNGKGEFHAVLIDYWTKIRSKDPKFGLRKKHAHYDVDGDAKVQKAYADGTFKPYEDPWHLVQAACLNLGRMWGCRGDKEMASLQEHQVIRGVHPPPVMNSRAWTSSALNGTSTSQTNSRSPTYVLVPKKTSPIKSQRIQMIPCVVFAS